MDIVQKTTKSPTYQECETDKAHMLFTGSSRAWSQQPPIHTLTKDVKKKPLRLFVGIS
jgi:hypothetical protein